MPSRVRHESSDESTSLQDCTSYQTYGTNSDLRVNFNDRSSSHSCLRTASQLASYVLGKICIPLLVILVVPTAALYVGSPLVAHIVIVGNYFELSSKSDSGSSQPVTNVTAMNQQLSSSLLQLQSALGRPDGGCDIPSSVNSLPAMPILPQNFSMDTVCYGANASNIAMVTKCAQVLGRVKTEMGFPHSTDSLNAMMLYGLNGEYFLQLMDLGMKLLSQYIHDTWPHCTPFAEQSLCQFFFAPLVAEPGKVLMLNQSFCERAKYQECKVGWQKASDLISKLVSDCSKSFPILQFLHLPQCEHMPQTSLADVATCQFSGINIDVFAKKCQEFTQYPRVSLIVQDIVFLGTMLGGVVMAIAGCVLPCFMNRVTGQIFPYFVLPIKAILLSFYSLSILVPYAAIPTNSQRSLFCKKNATMMDSFRNPPDMCKVTVLSYQFLTLAITAVWLASLILAAIRMGAGSKNPKPSVGQRFSNVALALAVSLVCLLPSTVNLLSKVDVVIPRRPTVMCSFKDPSMTLASYTLPMLLMTFIGLMLQLYLVLKTQKDLRLVLSIDSRERVARESEYFPLKSVLRFLLFHLLLSLLIIPFAALASSTQVSATIFEFELSLPGFNSSKLDVLPLAVLLIPLLFGYVGAVALLVYFSVQWCRVTCSQQ